MRGSPWLVHFVHDLLQHLYILQVEIHTPHSNSRRDDKKFTFFESFYEVLLRWNIRYPDMQSFNVAKLVFCLSWPSHFLLEYGHLTLESFVFGQTPRWMFGQTINLVLLIETVEPLVSVTRQSSGAGCSRQQESSQILLILLRLKFIFACNSYFAVGEFAVFCENLHILAIYFSQISTEAFINN